MSILKTIQKWSAYRQTVRELSALDNHALDDMGIGRGDIPGIAKEFTHRM